MTLTLWMRIVLLLGMASHAVHSMPTGYRSVRQLRCGALGDTPRASDFERRRAASRQSRTGVRAPGDVRMSPKDGARRGLPCPVRWWAHKPPDGLGGLWKLR